MLAVCMRQRGKPVIMTCRVVGVARGVSSDPRYRLALGGSLADLSIGDQLHIHSWCLMFDVAFGASTSSLHCHLCVITMFSLAWVPLPSTKSRERPTRRGV